MDRDKAKIEIKEALAKLFENCGEVGDNREGYIGDETINLMAEAALCVLLSTEDEYEYLKREDMIK